MDPYALEQKVVPRHLKGAMQSEKLQQSVIERTEVDVTKRQEKELLDIAYPTSDILKGSNIYQWSLRNGSSRCKNIDCKCKEKRVNYSCIG